MWGTVPAEPGTGCLAHTADPHNPPSFLKMVKIKETLTLNATTTNLWLFASI